MGREECWGRQVRPPEAQAEEEMLFLGRWGLSGMGLLLRGARSWFEIKVCTHPPHPHHREPVSLAFDPPVDLPGSPQSLRVAFFSGGMGRPKVERILLSHSTL